MAGKTLDTLVALVQNRGRVLGKDELLSRLWPDTVVEDANLTQSIFTLRKVLGDSPKNPRYIATVSGRGYQFVAPVAEVAPALIPAGTSSQRAGLPASRRRSVLWAVTTLCAAFDSRRDLALDRQPGARRGGAALPAGAFYQCFGMGTIPVLLARRQRDCLCVGAGKRGRSEHLRETGWRRNRASPYKPARARLARRGGHRMDGISPSIARRPAPQGITSFQLSGDLRARFSGRIRTKREGLTGLRMASTSSLRRLVCRAGTQPSWQGAHPMRLVSVDIDTGSQTVLTAPPTGMIGDGEPTFSPDGKKLAFVRIAADSVADIYLLEANGRPRRLTGYGAGIGGIAWTSDSREIVFSLVLDGGARLRRARRVAGWRARLRRTRKIYTDPPSPDMETGSPTLSVRKMKISGKSTSQAPIFREQQPFPHAWCIRAGRSEIPCIRPTAVSLRLIPIVPVRTRYGSAMPMAVTQCS